MRYLVTGGAGFIGSTLCDALLRRGDSVVCVDNFNAYYAPERKRRNTLAAAEHPAYTLVEVDLRDEAALAAIFAEHRPERVAHLAAMAGPRPSMEQPSIYADVNIVATLNVLRLAGQTGVGGLFLASTSSVYGLSPTPWSETSATDRPLSYYAATKKAAEVLAFTAHRQYGTPTQIGRFFTVYGPRGRPDMTPSLFVRPMLEGRPITLFDGGVGVYRDWTYIDDIVAGVMAALDSQLPYEIFNLGNSRPVQLRDFVAALERVSGLTAQIDAQPLPPADPPVTFADTEKAGRLLHWEPHTSVEQGLEQFWRWYSREIIAKDA